MNIGIIGPGRIGGNIARQAVRAGHRVILSFSRDPDRLGALAADIGHLASAGSVRDAITTDLTVLSVPWSVVGDALAEAGDLTGRLVVDTTNGFGPGRRAGQTRAAFQAARMPGARYTKSFNTLTAAFQAKVAGRTGDERVVQWICGDDAGARSALAAFIDSIGYAPVDLGGTSTCAVMESPRRTGAVYGEEYRLADAAAVVEAVRAGRPIPPTPRY